MLADLSVHSWPLLSNIIIHGSNSNQQYIQGSFPIHWLATDIIFLLVAIFKQKNHLGFSLTDSLIAKKLEAKVLLNSFKL